MAKAQSPPGFGLVCSDLTDVFAVLTPERHKTAV